MRIHGGMYRKTSRQRTIFEADTQLSESVKRRLDDSWAVGFASKVLPVLLESEDEFSALYCANNGRPNWSIARMLGLCILQEMHNMDDQSALDSLAFDIRWQHALGLEQDSAYLSRRAFVDFRSRWVSVDPEMAKLRALFDKIGETAIKDLGISTKEQRLDSTAITSNIRIFGRVDLFKKTLTNFLGWILKEHSSLYSELSSPLKKWHGKIQDNGWFGSIVKLDKKTKRELLLTLAGWLYEIDQRFGNEELVKGAEPYLLVKRLLSEHCEVAGSDKSDDDTGNRNTGGDDNPGSKVKVLRKMNSPSTSLQSPFDPDAGYSGHKGSGYFVHITETCNNDTTEIITDYFVEPASTDICKDQIVIDNLVASNKVPEVLYEDGGYPTAQGMVDAQEKGIQIIAPLPSKGAQPKDAICRDQFQYDKDGKCTACPAGHAPLRHGMRTSSSKPNPTLHVFFDGKKCVGCELKTRCMVRAPNNKKGKIYHLEIDPALIERDRRKTEQQSQEWWDRYRIRSGVEATMSEMKRVNGLGKLRVRRIRRVTLAVGLKVSACNVKRWLRAAAKTNSDRDPSRPSGNREDPRFRGALIAAFVRLKRKLENISFFVLTVIELLRPSDKDFLAKTKSREIAVVSRKPSRRPALEQWLRRHTHMVKTEKVQLKSLMIST